MVVRNAVSSRKKRVPNRGRPARPLPKPQRHPSATAWFTVSVCGYPINIFLVSEFDNPLQLGEYDSDFHEIYLLRHYHTDAEKHDSLLHEVMHAISRIALTADDRLSERQINTFSTVLHDTLKRNPDFRKQLGL